MPKTYLCTNQACALGAPGQSGRFTGGATKETILMLTGDPDPKDHGQGVCPNCGLKGREEK
jgi:hypothetical protein